MIEVTRGGRVESEHAVLAAIVDTRGGHVLAAGDIARSHYPRSAIKAMLALPLVSSGIADRFGLDDRSLALACASHTGEPAHVEVAATTLRACGHDETALACGAHWPTSREAAHALAAAGAQACALHNNCSGKHAGLVCLAVGLGRPVAGYEQPEHEAMRAAVGAVAALTGVAHDDANRAIDGCSIPTHAIPLEALALAFARFCTGDGMGEADAEAACRLRRAVAAHPDLLAGPGRFDTILTQAFGGRVFVKGGAEGICCAGLPDLGLGIAVKALDGASRAADAAVAALLARELGRDAVLDEATHRPILNWRRTRVGVIRVAASDARQAGPL